MEGHLSFESLAASKRVLVVISHQDDEALFCGGLLSNLAGACDLTVICMAAAKQKRDVEGRNAWFRSVCEKLGARAVTSSFRDARHVWSSADLLFRKRPEQIQAMREFLRAQAETLTPDLVITHNEAGEYGHCYHKVVHRLCREVFDGERLYLIGVGSRENGQRRFVVKYDPQKKKQLMDCYPIFDVATFCKRFFGADITYQPETYGACGRRPPWKPAGPIAIACGLCRDFLRFWVRAVRAKARIPLGGGLR